MLARITFEEIMACYGGNETAYAGLKESYKKNKTVPFVGAGLCVPFGYKQWSGLLKELATLLSDSTSKNLVNAQIDAGRFLDAAQEIHDRGGSVMFDTLQRLVSIDIYKKCDTSVQQDSVMMLLPELFPDTPVITTNFDQVLEQVYLEVRSDYLNKCTPYDQPQLTQLSQRNAHILLKLHGDIGPGICSTDKLVFTKEQYDQVYAPGAPLTEALSNLFRNNSMLFLGASLAQDRTTDILKEVHEKYPDTRHYAILSYPKTQTELEKIMRRLDKLGVLPIFFPTQEYSCIRVILEELLGKSPNPCAKLPEQNHSAQDKSPSARLVYDSGCVDFVGRTKEMSLLEEFCQKDDPILWWVVTAPGGMGKSRLVHEFVRKMEDKGWEKLWLRKEECGSLRDLDMPPGDCILVTDDVQGYFHDLKKCLPAILKQHRGGKLRILLLERDGKDLKSSSWGDMVVSDPYDNPLENYAYSQEFLQLKPLSPQNLTAIMTSYAEKLGYPITNEKVADKLLKALTDVDKELLRPLYALVIADAWCNGDSPTKWTRKQLLDKLLDRELSFFYNRLQSILGKQPTKAKRKALESLLAHSCVRKPLLLDGMEQTLYAGLCPDYMELYDFLEYLGVVRKIILMKRIRSDDGKIKTAETMQTEAVILECPDLVKEYLVIRKAFDENGWKELLLPECWLEDSQRMNCLFRLLVDYPDRLERETRFMDAFLTAEPNSPEVAARYAFLLFGITSEIPGFIHRAVEKLETLHETEAFKHDPKIALQYANGLVNLSNKQDLTGREEFVRKLKALHDAFEDNPGIAVAYTGALVSLSYKQWRDQRLEAEVAQTLSQAKDVAHQFPGNAEIQLNCAMTWFNLTLVQTGESRTTTIQSLRQYLQTHPDVNRELQPQLDAFLTDHPEHTAIYASLRV